jgi:hypothetical protein
MDGSFTMKIGTIAALAVMVCAGIGFGDTYSGGSGTAEDPYKISTAADWQELIAASTDWDKRFVLLNDIDFGGQPLTPIGNISTGFTGIFDGQGHVLRNAVLNLSSDWVGLFGSISSPGLVENLVIDNITVTARRTIGGLCGYNSGTIVGCCVSGSISGLSSIGGLCGNNVGMINDCSSSGSVTGGFTWDDIGGLCGVNSGTITSSYSSATVTGGSNSKNVGGLCGQNNHGTIRLCWASGPVTGGDYIMRYGGLCGGSAGLIEACYATGSVTGGLEAGRFGGLCGENGDSIQLSYATKCCRGKILDSSRRIMRIIGQSRYQLLRYRQCHRGDENRGFNWEQWREYCVLLFDRKTDRDLRCRGIVRI